jgi:hypothetical protein
MCLDQCCCMSAPAHVHNLINPIAAIVCPAELGLKQWQLQGGNAVALVNALYELVQQQQGLLGSKEQLQVRAERSSLATCNTQHSKRRRTLLCHHRRPLVSLSSRRLPQPAYHQAAVPVSSCSCSDWCQQCSSTGTWGATRHVLRVLCPAG